DPEPVVGQAQHQARVTDPESAEDSEGSGHERLPHVRRPHRRHHEAEGGGAEDDGQRSPQRALVDETDQLQAETRGPNDEDEPAEDLGIPRGLDWHGHFPNDLDGACGSLKTDVGCQRAPPLSLSGYSEDERASRHARYPTCTPAGRPGTAPFFAIFTGAGRTAKTMGEGYGRNSPRRSRPHTRARRRR